jgi:hypothetical protein
MTSSLLQHAADDRQRHQQSRTAAQVTWTPGALPEIRDNQENLTTAAAMVSAWKSRGSRIFPEIVPVGQLSVFGKCSFAVPLAE